LNRTRTRKSRICGPRYSFTGADAVVDAARDARRDAPFRVAIARASARAAIAARGGASPCAALVVLLRRRGERAGDEIRADVALRNE
jgi:hypothetical protein